MDAPASSALGSPDIALLEPERAARTDLLEVLRGGGLSCAAFPSTEALLALLRPDAPGPRVLVLGLDEARGDVETLLRPFRGASSSLGRPALVVQAPLRRAEEAARALNFGASEYLLRPFSSPGAVLSVIQRALSVSGSRRSTPPPSTRAGRPVLAGTSPAIRRVNEQIERVAHADVPVLVTGEGGTGKEFVARSLHGRGPRCAGPFVVADCSAGPTEEVDEELFGVGGGFGSERGGRPGRAQTAHGGTLFLDEVSYLGSPSQGRLMRLLEEGFVMAKGGNGTLPVDVRVVAATHNDLADAVMRGLFREDLYYALSVIRIELPPLRDRLVDLPELVEVIALRFASILGRTAPPFSAAALQMLGGYHWPGNVRQLVTVVERAVLLAEHEVTDEEIHLDEAGSSSRIRIEQVAPSPESATVPITPLREAREDFEHRYLARLLDVTQGNRSNAARIAHLDPSNLRRLLKRHGLD